MAYIEYIDSEFRELIPRFLEKTQEELNEIKLLCCDFNYKKIAAIGHRIRGAALNYGFKRIGFFGEMIEYYAENKDMSGLDRLILYFNYYLDTINIEYLDF